MATRETKKILEDITRLRKEEDKYIKMNLKSEKDFTRAINKRRDDINKLAAELRNANSEQLKQNADIEKSISGISDTYQTFKNSQTDSLAVLKTSGDLTADQKDKVANLLSLSRDLADLNVEDVEQISAKVDQYENELDFLKKNSKISKELLKTLENQFDNAQNIAALSETEKNILEKQTNASKQVKETFQGISETVQTTLTNLNQLGVLDYYITQVI